MQTGMLHDSHAIDTNSFRNQDNSSWLNLKTYIHSSH